MTRAQDWASIRDSAITAYEARPDAATQVAHAHAYMAGARARQAGSWMDSSVTAYLATVYSKRKPDGGWGLDSDYDNFGDGSVNPASTTYTVTLADHVGPVLLDAFRSGHPSVAWADIQACASLLMTTQSYLFTSGRCLAYSRSSNDAVNATNDKGVHNASVLAGWFLLQAQAAGFSAGGLNQRVVDIVRHEVASYNRSTKFWPYRGDQADSDTDHTAAEAWAMYSLAYPLGRESAYRIMTDPTTTDEPMATVARARLTNLPGQPGSWSTTEPGATLWAVLGDNWLADCAAFVADPPSTRALAQMAYWAAINAEVT